MLIRSRTADSASGGELEVVGGVASPVAPVGCPVGTTIEVRNLFFNTPVRHKFLRSAQTEMGHSIEAMTRLALAHPQIHFTLSHNGRTGARSAAGVRISADELRRFLATSWPTI